MKISPSEIVRRYWQWPWHFMENGDLRIDTPNGVKIIRQADYVPKAQWLTP